MFYFHSFNIDDEQEYICMRYSVFLALITTKKALFKTTYFVESAYFKNKNENYLLVVTTQISYFWQLQLPITNKHSKQFLIHGHKSTRFIIKYIKYNHPNNSYHHYHYYLNYYIIIIYCIFCFIIIIIKGCIYRGLYGGCFGIFYSLLMDFMLVMILLCFIMV